MSIITIPKKLAQAGDLVVLPREEYEGLVDFRARFVKEVPMTKAQKLALNRARKNIARGDYLTLDEFKRELGLKNR